MQRVITTAPQTPDVAGFSLAGRQSRQTGSGDCRLRFKAALASGLMVLMSSLAIAHGRERVRSGIYQTSADYTAGRLALAGECGSKAYNLELHDVLDKPYIDATNGTERRRYQKRDLFGFRGCDGRDYRFGGTHEYRILEARELYIYGHEAQVPAVKGFRTVLSYSFSVGPDGPLLPLTLEDLKRAFPENDKFQDSLDVMFACGRDIARYDDFHKMFDVNRLLMASREHEP